jgi:[acyl-carrier-protein] S-malonyltransferase
MSKEGKVVYVFPGQGSQQVGMGRYLYDNFGQARATFEEVDSVLGFSLSRLCFEGPEEVLRQTINAQPAILAMSMVHRRVFPELWDRYEVSAPDFVAGHSLGEYTALVAAKTLSFADALCLARERGRLMQEAGEKSPGGMAAIIGLDEEVIEDICEQAEAQIANINCPGQVVVSGSIEAIGRITELATAGGARRVIPLEVSGAFHSPLMQPAFLEMSKVIPEVAFHDADIPVVANTTALPITTVEAVKDELLNQLCHCVQWQRSIEYTIENGASTFIEIGPGQVLTGLIKRINKEVQTLNTEDMVPSEGA